MRKLTILLILLMALAMIYAVYKEIQPTTYAIQFIEPHQYTPELRKKYDSFPLVLDITIEKEVLEYVKNATFIVKLEVTLFERKNGKTEKTVIHMPLELKEERKTIRRLILYPKSPKPKTLIIAVDSIEGIKYQGCKGVKAYSIGNISYLESLTVHIKIYEKDGVLVWSLMKWEPMKK